MGATVRDQEHVKLARLTCHTPASKLSRRYVASRSHSSKSV